MQRRSKKSEEGWLLSYADLITNLLIFFVMLLAASNINTVKFQEISEGLSGTKNKSNLTQIKKEIDDKIKKVGLEGQVYTTKTANGLEISINSGLVFDVGKAEIRPEWSNIINKLLSTLSPYSKQYVFAVEGHSDSTPISKGSLFFSNWELSSSRAIKIREKLELSGVDKERIKVEAYADIKKLPEKDLEGLSEEQKLARHRRVVVRIY